MPENIRVAVKGINFRGREAIEAVWKFRPGDLVRLEREVGNKHDANAVKVHFVGIWIGYLAKEGNGRIAAALDAGMPPTSMTAEVIVLPEYRKAKMVGDPVLSVRW